MKQLTILLYLGRIKADRAGTFILMDKLDSLQDNAPQQSPFPPPKLQHHECTNSAKMQSLVVFIPYQGHLHTKKKISF